MATLMAMRQRPPKDDGAAKRPEEGRETCILARTDDLPHPGRCMPVMPDCHDPCGIIPDLFPGDFSMRSARRLAAALFATLAVTPAAYAWGPLGHSVVAELA